MTDPDLPRWASYFQAYFNPEIASSSTLNRTAVRSSDRQLAVAGAGQVIPLTYGEDRIGASILNVLSGGMGVVIQCLWGFECDSIDALELNDTDPTTIGDGAIITHYTGSQVVTDTNLVGAFLTIGIDYTDTLHGYAYSVISIPATSFSGSLNITALVRGRKVYDPRGPSTAWSDNPSLCLADFLTDTTYGAGLSVGWASVEDAADWNDTDLGAGDKHRTLGLTLMNPARVEDVIETLRTYAGVFLVRRGNTVYFVQDKARASDATYAHASGQIVEFSSFTKRDLGDSPTVVEIQYTDTTYVPWRDGSAFAELPGVGTTLPRRLSTVRLPGIQRYSQAAREATERLNKTAGNDLSGGVVVFDAGIAHEPGDVVTLSLPIGIVSKAFRVASPPEAVGPGLWKLEVVEYDPAVYDTSVRTTPTYPDASLPNPNAPPVPTSITADDELIQLADGTWVTRVRITLGAPSFPFLSGYRVETLDGTTLVDSGTTASASYATPPLQDGVPYTVKAQSISTTGVASAWIQTSITLTSKTIPPTDVGSITGFEVGGDVYLSWSAAADIDLKDYELRWGLTSDTWDTAALLDRIVALRYVSKGVISAGTRRVFVKARDWVGNYSATAAYCDIVVTIDPDTLQSGYNPSSPTLTAMVNFTERDGSSYDITVVGTGVVSGVLTGTMSTYTQPVAAYWGGTSEWQGDTGADPWGAVIAGDWGLEGNQTVVGTGSSLSTMRLSTDGTAFTDTTSFPTKSSARYARAKLTTTQCIKVTRGTPRISVNAVTRSEYGSVSVASTGTPGAVVQMTGKYFTRRYVQLTPIGTSALIAVADNIQLTSGTGTNSFDVYCFDAAGSRVAATVDWSFQGI